MFLLVKPKMNFTHHLPATEEVNPQLSVCFGRRSTPRPRQNYKCLVRCRKQASQPRAHQRSSLMTGSVRNNWIA